MRTRRPSSARLSNGRAERRVEVDLVSQALLAESADPDGEGDEPLPA